MREEDHLHPMEAELKLAVPSGQGARLLQHPAFRAALASSPEEQHEVTTYFDTPDLALAREGFSLRVRRTGERRVQTLKARNAANSVALRRGEWEWPIEQDEPDLGLLAQVPPDQVPPGHIDGHLQPVSVTDIRRTLCGLHLAGGTQVEAAFDEGNILVGEAREPVSELELELKAGAPGLLYRLALDLHAAVPLAVSAESKAERGARLKTGEAPAVHKAADPHLPHDADIADGVRRVIESCLGQFVANRAAALAGSPEGVHQTRISMRRLRSALVLFDEHLRRRASKRFDSKLKRLGRVLGEARDWDVFCLETLPAATKAAPGKNWAGLRKAADAKRRSAHRRLRAKLSGPAVTSLVLELAAEGAGEPGASALLKTSARRSLAAEAPDMLDRLARRAAKRGRHLGRLSEDELHALRKSLKKLRYGMDFLGGLYGHKQVKSYVHHCKELQEGLGSFNDAAVAEDLTRRLGGGDAARLAVPAEAVARWGRERRAKALQHLAGGWKEFKAAAPFWR